MAIVETLEIRFQAEMGKLETQLKQLSTQVLGLGNALDAGRIQLAASVQGLIQTVADALISGSAVSSAPVTAGSMMADRFSGGISAGRSGASSAASGVVSAARFSSSSAVSSAYSAGYSLSLGYAGGIRAGRSAVVSAVNSIISAASGRFRGSRALRAYLPNAEAEGAFGETLAGDVRAAMRDARASVSALAADADFAAQLRGDASPASMGDGGGLGTMVQRAVSEALGGTSIVIPMYVDGMKLGEASIRGINRVTRSAGRMMLEI